MLSQNQPTPKHTDPEYSKNDRESQTNSKEIAKFKFNFRERSRGTDDRSLWTYQEIPATGDEFRKFITGHVKTNKADTCQIGFNKTIGVRTLETLITEQNPYKYVIVDIDGDVSYKEELYPQNPDEFDKKLLRNITEISKEIPGFVFGNTTHRGGIHLVFRISQANIDGAHTTQLLKLASVEIYDKVEDLLCEGLEKYLTVDIGASRPTFAILMNDNGLVCGESMGETNKYNIDHLVPRAAAQEREEQQKIAAVKQRRKEYLQNNDIHPNLIPDLLRHMNNEIGSVDTNDKFVELCYDFAHGEGFELEYDEVDFIFQGGDGHDYYDNKRRYNSIKSSKASDPKGFKYYIETTNFFGCHDKGQYYKNNNHSRPVSNDTRELIKGGVDVLKIAVDDIPALISNYFDNHGESVVKSKKTSVTDEKRRISFLLGNLKHCSNDEQLSLLRSLLALFPKGSDDEMSKLVKFFKGGTGNDHSAVLFETKFYYSVRNVLKIWDSVGKRIKQKEVATAVGNGVSVLDFVDSDTKKADLLDKVVLRTFQVINNSLIRIKQAFYMVDNSDGVIVVSPLNDINDVKNTISNPITEELIELHTQKGAPLIHPKTVTETVNGVLSSFKIPKALEISAGKNFVKEVKEGVSRDRAYNRILFFNGVMDFVKGRFVGRDESEFDEYKGEIFLSGVDYRRCNFVGKRGKYDFENSDNIDTIMNNIDEQYKDHAKKFIDGLIKPVVADESSQSLLINCLLNTLGVGSRNVDRALLFLHGESGSGKTTILNLLRGARDGYSRDGELSTITDFAKADRVLSDYVSIGKVGDVNLNARNNAFMLEPAFNKQFIAVEELGKEITNDVWEDLKKLTGTSTVAVNRKNKTEEAMETGQDVFVVVVSNHNIFKSISNANIDPYEQRTWYFSLSSISRANQDTSINSWGKDEKFIDAINSLAALNSLMNRQTKRVYEKPSEANELFEQIRQGRGNALNQFLEDSDDVDRILLPVKDVVADFRKYLNQNEDGYSKPMTQSQLPGKLEEAEQERLPQTIRTRKASRVLGDQVIMKIHKVDGKRKEVPSVNIYRYLMTKAISDDIVDDVINPVLISDEKLQGRDIQTCCERSVDYLKKVIKITITEKKFSELAADTILKGLIDRWKGIDTTQNQHNLVRDLFFAYHYIARDVRVENNNKLYQTIVDLMSKSAKNDVNNTLN